MNLNLPGNIISINDVKERKVKNERPYLVSDRKLLAIIFIGLWVIDCLIAAWIIFHAVCG